MENLEIAFDLKGFQEYFIKYKKKEYKGKLAKGKTKTYYIFEKKKPSPENLGTFLLTFLNTDFKKKETCKDFIFEYLYINLLTLANNRIHLESEIHGDDIYPTDITKVSYDIILSEEEIDYYFDEIYTKYKDNLIYYQKLYTAVANFKYFDFLANEITSRSKENKLKKAMIKESSKTETYHTSLSNIATTTLFLNIHFNLRTFFTDKNRNFVIENIPYSFSSKYFYDILFISFREFAYMKKDIIIQQCENCKKYFIPTTAHDTKYCDSVFKGKKTCKEIGAQKSYAEKLENNRLLKKWRTRYQTLAGLASKTKPGSKSKAPEMYEYYKKEGAIMKDKYEKGEITGKQFEKWIDSTKLKKTP